jgi:hypothetical protein
MGNVFGASAKMSREEEITVRKLPDRDLRALERGLVRLFLLASGRRPGVL